VEEERERCFSCIIRASFIIASRSSRLVVSERSDSAYQVVKKDVRETGGKKEGKRTYLFQKVKGLWGAFV
jgi:hypothetical protein